MVYSIHQRASHAGYLGKLMSRPITVIKEKKKKNCAALLRLLICIGTHSTWSRGLCLANHKAETQIMHPVCEAGYSNWIEYRKGLDHVDCVFLLSIRLRFYLSFSAATQTKPVS